MVICCCHWLSSCSWPHLIQYRQVGKYISYYIINHLFPVQSKKCSGLSCVKGQVEFVWGCTCIWTCSWNAFDVSLCHCCQILIISSSIILIVHNHRLRTVSPSSQPCSTPCFFTTLKPHSRHAPAIPLLIAINLPCRVVSVLKVTFGHVVYLSSNLLYGRELPSC